MHGNLGWRSTWKCPAGAHSQEVLSCMILQINVLWLPACRLLLATVLDAFVYWLRFLHLLIAKVSEGSHKGEFSGKEASCSFPRTADLEMRDVHPQWRIISHFFFFTSSAFHPPSPLCLTHYCVWSSIKVLPFPFLLPLTPNFPCKTTAF